MITLLNLRVDLTSDGASAAVIISEHLLNNSWLHPRPQAMLMTEQALMTDILQLFLILDLVGFVMAMHGVHACDDRGWSVTSPKVYEHHNYVSTYEFVI